MKLNKTQTKIMEALVGKRTGVQVFVKPGGTRHAFIHMQKWWEYRRERTSGVRLLKAAEALVDMGLVEVVNRSYEPYGHGNSTETALTVALTDAGREVMA